MAKNRKINVQGVDIILYKTDNSDYISLTDMTKAFREGSSLIGKWITNKNTLEYIGIWEKINNPDFNYPEFGVIEREAGSNRFIMSVGQWVERTKAIGLEVKTGIPLHPIAEQILSLYTKEESKEDYKIFPDTMSKSKLLTHLKAVGLACSIRTPLSYHIGRMST